MSNIKCEAGRISDIATRYHSFAATACRQRKPDFLPLPGFVRLSVHSNSVLHFESI